MAEPRATTFLWFQDRAEEAVRFYVSVFADGKILEESRCGEGGPVPKGSPLTVRFRVAGLEIVALNGGAPVHFNESFSLMVQCDDQRQIDELWAKLTEGGKPGQCGWLVDKFGLSWQVVPRGLVELLTDRDPARAARATAALRQMGKLDIAAVRRAADGK